MRQFAFALFSGQSFDINSISSKLAGWWENNIDQLQPSGQSRELLTQNSQAGQLFPGRSILYNGSNQNTLVSDSGVLNATVPLSFSFWVKPKSLSYTYTTSHIVGKSSVSFVSGRYGASFNNSGIRFYFHTSAGLQFFDSSSGVAVDTWVHVVCIIGNDGNAYKYHNGTQVNGASFSGTPAALTSEKFRIGSIGDASGYTNIEIRDVRLFLNKHLTPSEVSTIYSGGYVSGFTEWWPCSDNSLTRLHSARNGGLHGINYNFDVNSFTNGYWSQPYNVYGYAENATYGQIPPDLSSSSPTTDCYGNSLVFQGQAKYNLTLSGDNRTLFGGAKDTQIDNLLNSCALIGLDTWFSSGVAQAIEPHEYCGMRQFYNGITLLIIKNGEYLTQAEEFSLVSKMGILRAHTYHASSQSLFARFTNTISERDKSIYDNAIRLVQGHWSKYECLTNTAPYKEEMLLDWVSASNDLAETGPRLAYVPYKGRAAQTDTWQANFNYSTSAKFLQNDCFIAWKHSENLSIPSGASSAFMFINDGNIGAFWDYDTTANKRWLNVWLNSTGGGIGTINGHSIDPNSTILVNRTGATSLNLVSNSFYESTSSGISSVSRSSEKIYLGLGWYQNYFQHFSCGGSLSREESELHCNVFDCFNNQMNLFSGEWVVDGDVKYKLFDKVVLDRIGDSIFWSDYKNIYYSTDNGETVSASIAFDSHTYGWMHMAHIFDNGDIIFATNKNRMYGTTTALLSVSEIIVTKNGATYTPHSNTTGEYYKFIGPKYKQYLEDGTEIFVWNAYCVSVRGAAPTLVLYSLGVSNGVKIAREFGQNPYIRDNGSANGGTTGTWLGDPLVTSYVRHGHGVIQTNVKNKFLAMYGDVDRPALSPVPTNFYECKWEEGTYNQNDDTWSWSEIKECSQNERWKSTPGFVNSSGNVFWASDANVVEGNSVERGYFTAPLATAGDSSTHTRFYFPNQPSLPGNMFHLDSENFFMCGGYAAGGDSGGYLFNDPNIIYGTMGAAFTEKVLKVPGNVYIPVIHKISSKRYGVIIMSNYDYYRNAQYVELEFT